MPKFSRSTQYRGEQANKQKTGQSRFATNTEAEAGTSENLIISPATLADAVDNLMPDASTTVKGKIEIATDAEAVAGVSTTLAMTPHTVGLIAIAGAPLASEGTAGIAQLATQAQTNTGTDDTTIVTPLKLKTVLGNGSDPGSFTTLDASGAVTFASTGAISMTSDTASLFDVTGAGIDLTLSSDAGRVVVNGEEAAADAIRLLSAAGGLDVDVALQMNLASSQNAADAVSINASAGGIDITAAGAAGEDIDITNTAGSVNITAGENATDSIVISSSVGGININAAGAGAGEDITLTATGSSIVLTATENVGDSIVLSSTNGGIQILAPGAAAGEDIVLTATGSSVRLTSTESAVDAINIEATTGGMKLLASGAAAGEDIVLTATGSSVTVTSTEADSAAIRLYASDLAGGVDIDSGTAGIIADTTGAISLDAAAASNLTVTGAFALDLISTLGKVSLQSGQSAADSVEIKSLIGGIDILAAGAAAGEDIDIIATGSSVNIQATESDVNAITINASGVAGGVNIDAGTGGFIVDTTGAFSLDGVLASNITTTGAGVDLTLNSVLGSVLVESTEDAALAIRLHANGGVSETIQIHSDQGTGVGSVNLLSDVGGITLTSTGLASADAINLEATAGGIDADAALQINIASSQAAADAIQLTASNGAGGITMTTGSAGLAVTGDTVVTGALTTSGDLTLSSVATKIVMNGGAVTDFIGTGVLTAGTQTIANTNIAAGDVILFARTAVNASTALGIYTYTITPATSFTVTSMGVTTATVLAGDVSSYVYFIVRPS